MSKDSYGYDIETIINCFTASFIRTIDNVEMVFEISERKNDFRKLVEFLQQKPILIGYNNLNFDSPVLARLITHPAASLMAGNVLAYEIYQMAQEVILAEKKIRVSSLGLHELDLFLLHHFDNEAKFTSLKWIECHLMWHNIQDMPYPHDIPIDKKNIDDVIRYNLNDVRATIALARHNRTSELVEIRRWAVKTFSESKLYNVSNASLGEYMLMKRIDTTAEPYKRYDFTLKNIILPHIKFTTEKFDNVLRRLSLIRIADNISMPSVKVTTIFDGMEYQFGLGGLHAAREESYHEDIDTIDAVSYYPNISIQFKLAPRHLGDAFIKPYNEMFEMRTKTVKGSVQNAAWKEALNSAFGKSNSEFSKLFDPMFTFSITINGQLLLAMLAEKITMEGAGEIIMVNTDGLEVKTRDQDKLREIMKWWQEMTGITLEASRYSSILIRDVNNYIAMDAVKNKLKVKGAYESVKELHKDPSMLVVPQIVGELFTAGRLNKVGKTEIVDMLKAYAATSIFPFFMYQRAKTGEFIGRTYSGATVNFPKTMRYVIIKNNKEGYILARRSGSSESKIHKDAWIVPMNELDDEETPIADLIKKIDYEWYANEVEKLISFSRSYSPSLF